MWGKGKKKKDNVFLKKKRWSYFICLIKYICTRPKNKMSQKSSLITSTCTKISLILMLLYFYQKTLGKKTPIPLLFFVRFFLLFDLWIKCRVILVADSNSSYCAAKIYLMFRANQTLLMYINIAGFYVDPEIHTKIYKRG